MTGVGFNGQFILMMQLLRYFETIFAETPQKAAINILQLVDQIHLFQPGLIWSETELEMAIHHACMTREYGVKIGFNFDKPFHPVLESTPVPDWRSLLDGTKTLSLSQLKPSMAGVFKQPPECKISKLDEQENTKVTYTKLMPGFRATGENV